MKLQGLLCLIVMIPATAGAASIIDKETKEGVQSANQKISEIDAKLSRLEEKLTGLEQQHAPEYGTEIKGLQQQQEATLQLLKNYESLLTRLLNKLGELPAEVGKLIPPPAPATKVEVGPVKGTEERGVLPAGGTPATPEGPLGIPPAVTPRSSPTVSQISTSPENEARLSQLEQHLQKVEWGGALVIVLLGGGLIWSISQTKQTPVIPQQEEPSNPIDSHQRPHLRIELNHSYLRLINIGQAEADEIKLYLGPAPSTLKKRQSLIGQIPAGGRTELDISHLGAGTIYGNIEYRNPHNAKLYKEQFTLELDALAAS